MTSSALTAALAVFRELGWHRASIDEAPSLPLGTPEQRKTAVAGLRAGQWGRFREIPLEQELGLGPTSSMGFGSVRWTSFVGLKEAMLALFAIRVGVDARRARSLLDHCREVSDEVLTAVLADRGETFAARMVTQGGVRTAVVARLVAAMNLPVPESPDALAEWANWAANEAGVGWSSQQAPGADELLAPRFAEYVQAAVAAAVPGNDGLAAVLGYGAQRGWMQPEQAVGLALSGLDSARRPVDRKRWLALLLDDLGVEDSTLVEQASALVPLLSMGESVLVERLGPVLITGVDELTLGEVAVSSLTAPTKKSKLVVLKALAAHPLPPLEVRQAVVDQVAVLAVDRDAAVAKAATTLMASWHLSELAEPQAVPAVPDVAGWWQPTPAVWTLPRFERGEASPEALTRLAAQVILGDPADNDLTVEQFLAVAHELARRSASDARAALQGVNAWSQWGRWIRDWCDGTRTEPLYDGQRRFLYARDHLVLRHLDELPCLLSEPSFVDLSIDPGDLLARLRSYAQAGVNALAADLFVALARCDVRLASPELVATLKTVAVTVATADGGTLTQPAGQLVADYLVAPVGEPQLSFHAREGRWELVLPVMPPAFEPFGVVWDTIANYYGDYTFSVFPRWGDAGLVNRRWSADVPPELGQVHRQVARRRDPLTPGLAINLLAGARSCHQRALAEATQAVIEAWQRGLLRPGVADVGLLDWRRPPTAVAALAQTLLEFAEVGLASVVWPVLDDLLVAALDAPRLLAGAAEVAEAMVVLTPEVLAAVADGRADATAVDVPGVRALAARSGSSKAVLAARAVVAALPVVEAQATAVTAPTVVLDPPFEAYWTAQDPPVIEDGVTVRAEWVDRSAPTRMLRFALEVPGQPEPYFVTKGWTWDLECEGQCEARLKDEDSPEARNWLYWDDQVQAMQVKSRRWADGHQQVFADRPNPPLSSSLLTIAVGLAAQDGDNAWAGRNLVSQLVEDGHLGSTGVRVAMGALLNSSEVSPAKLAGMLAKAPHHLGALWPILTEPVRFAAANEELPRWLNPVLDLALCLAPYLREAAVRGLLGEGPAWPGLAELASRSSKSAAVKKAVRLQDALCAG